jgi:Peptidase family M28
MRRCIPTVTTAIAIFATQPICAQHDAVRIASGTEEAVATITPQDVIRRIGVLADDSMRGRDTPSPELDQVATWIGSEFARAGLRPGGDGGTFLQHYPLRRVQLDTQVSGIRLRGGLTWQFGRDVARFFGSTPREGRTGGISVLMGKPAGLDDLRAIDLSNRIVFWIVPNTAVGIADLGLVNQGFQVLLASNPRALVLVMNRSRASWQSALRAADQVSLVTGWDEAGTAPLIEVRDETAAPFLQQHGIRLASSRQEPFQLRALDNAQATVTVYERIVEELQAPNVVGILEGSDPVLKSEYVVFSAHMDHVGIGQPVNGDDIYNGADDDASGTAGVMELAEAFSALQPRPKRSFIFLTVSGEEHGLWGSDYFSLHPPVDIANIVADLNADMIGRNWKDTIVVIGKEHSDLGATLNRVNAAHPELDMTAIDDIWPEENFYFRSDHFNFARRGTPVLFFFNGTHDDYHRPSDEVDKIDGEKESRILKLMFYLGLDVANRTERPRWNPESYRRIVGSN